MDDVASDICEAVRDGAASSAGLTAAAAPQRVSFNDEANIVPRQDSDATAAGSVAPRQESNATAASSQRAPRQESNATTATAVSSSRPGSADSSDSEAGGL